MKEIVAIPSDDWILHGVVHRPGEIRGRRVGVVVVVGPNTKFGTHRVFPQVADALARAGFYVLRYDSRGTCDSPRVCNPTFAHRVADARAAAAFLRHRYRLDAVLGWGLCMGAAVGLHCAVKPSAREEEFDGLVLCSILAHPSQISLPQYGCGKIDLGAVGRNIVLHENPLRKLWSVLSRRENWTKKAPMLLRRYLRHDPPELNQLRTAIGQVGELLRRYEDPCLLIFGEKDRHLKQFREQVNPGDRLGLAEKKSPPGWAIVNDGDHTFSSLEQMAALVHYTVDWVEPFLHGLLPSPVSWPTADPGGSLTSPAPSPKQEPMNST